MFTIITPCSRPENLLKLAKSMFHIPYFRWVVCYDLSKVKEFVFPISVNANICGIEGGVMGNTQRNKAIEQIFDPDEYIYCLDDDNLMHHDIDKILFYLKDVRYDIITFDQEFNDGTIRKGDNPTLDHIDQAQYIIRKKIIEPYEQDHGADGKQIESLVNKYRDKWLYLPITMCYYNHLNK